LISTVGETRRGDDAVDAGRSKEKFLRGRRDLRLEREEARHERALHHADVDGLADVHHEAEDLRAGNVCGGGDVEAVDAAVAPPAGY